MRCEVCPNCGSNEFSIKDGYMICEYCNSKIRMTSAKDKHSESIISLQSDIDLLLQKCKDEPMNSRKYAELILDIDPTNREAPKYLR